MPIEKPKQSESLQSHSFLADVQNLRTGLFALLLALSPMGCKKEAIDSSASCPPCQPCKDCPSEVMKPTEIRDAGVADSQPVDTTKSTDSGKKRKKELWYLKTRLRPNTLVKPEESEDAFQRAIKGFNTSVKPEE